MGKFSSRRTQPWREVCGAQRGQGNFDLAANSDYDSRGSADPRESLRRRRISKLALNAHLQNLPLAAFSDAMQQSVASHRLPTSEAVFPIF